MINLKSTTQFASFMASALVCSTMLLTLSAPIAVAQEEENRWYQVEVIAFAHRGIAEDKEQWPTDIALAYPPNWMELQNETPAGQNIASTPYVILPQQERELDDELLSLKRNGAFRVLFHQAWRQPMEGKEKAPAIIVRGGEQFEDHYELEGTITLHISRYLHLRTNLWYSRFAVNYGQESLSEWPELPSLPTRTMEQGFSLVGPEGDDSWSNFSQFPEANFIADIDRPYVIDRIVKLQQKRRLRSNELHYVDHPLVGILIKMQPYAIPDQDSSLPSNATE